MNRHIGIYTGTFDPIHRGHTAFSQEALVACKLDEVILIPETLPRGKPTVTTVTQRLALIEQATAPLRSISVMMLETTRFTVQDTLPELERRFAGATFTLLVGSDVVQTFLYRWDDLDMLFSRVSLAIGMREGDTREEMRTIIAQLEQQYNVTIAHTFVQTEHAAMASSHIRENAS